MRRAAILYNPRSGSGRSRRRSDVESAAAILRASGVEVEMEPTVGARLAGAQARRFIDAGFDTIVASGGDGTVHDVLQGMAGGDAALGVLPLGTANSLACDLGLARNPEKAARQLLTAEVRRVALGQIEYQRASGERECRYFTVAAGVGVDAALFYKLNAQFKRRWGMAAYVAESFRQWAVQKFPPFRVQWHDSGSGNTRSEVVTQLLAVRIADFGGVLKRLAPGAGLERDDFRLVLFKTASRARYLRFAFGRLTGMSWRDRQIEFATAAEVVCRPEVQSDRIYSEADGELLGGLPVRITIAPSGLNLLMPHK
jgi:YegS/Rv2252/BmrU family lipid kinase